MRVEQAVRIDTHPHQPPAFAGTGHGTSIGGYEQWINSQTDDAVQHCLLRLDPVPGESVLEIAIGAGTMAERLAIEGVHMSVMDIRKKPNDIAGQFDKSPDFDYRVGNPESLPFGDAAFDGVVLPFAVGDLSDPCRVADELARVTKPGGRIALATWAPWDGASEMFDLIGSLGLSCPSTSAAMFDWGQSWWLEELLGDSFDLGFEVGHCDYRARDPRWAWQSFAHGSGTNVARFDPALDAGVRSKFDAFHDRYRTDLGIQIPRTYLITIGRRD